MTDPRAALYGDRPIPGDGGESDRPGAPAADTGSQADKLQAQLVDSAGLDDIPPPVSLIDGVLYTDSLAWVYGAPGHCKSFVALDMAGCVNAGIEWHGHPTRACQVLYCALEGWSGLRPRVRAWEDWYGTPMGAKFLPGPIHLPGHEYVLAEVADRIKAGMIIVDTQAWATVGLDEVSSKDMGLFVSALEVIRARTHANITVIHHTAFGGDRPRGHTTIDGAATSMIRVAKDGELVKLDMHKQKDVAAANAIVLTATPQAGGLVLSMGNGGRSESERVVQRCLRQLVAVKGSATWTDLKRLTRDFGMPERTFNWALQRLVERGAARKEGHRYVLALPGEQTLS